MMPAAKDSGRSTTAVRCRKCGYRNLGIDIRCALCGYPLDWETVSRPPGPAHAWSLRDRLPSLRWHQRSGAVLAVAGALAIAAALPLVAIARAAAHPVARGGVLAVHVQAAAPATRVFQTPLDAAVAATHAKTGLPYVADGCQPFESCLMQPNETDGVSAATVQFATTASGKTGCLAYVVQRDDGWHGYDVVCGQTDSLTPARGQSASVSPQAGCVNVRDSAGLAGTVVSCLAGGTVATIDDGPTYADQTLWWHLQSLGWLAQEFLLPP